MAPPTRLALLVLLLVMVLPSSTGFLAVGFPSHRTYSLHAASSDDTPDFSSDPILAEMSILQANSAFYDSFRSKNLKNMRHLWSTSEEATCAHPGMATIFGGEKIIKSWEALFSGGSMPPLRATRQKVVLRGDIAWVTCCESTGSSSDPSFLEAINIFERKEGRWVMVHHQAAPVLPIFRERTAG
mmetsp:Transcript_22538/g.42359  ORF Transcript_22538/g.42359 Transcript_22538/m.42359 type:complete len:185 (+) Transcript_22538:198-752(+)|eukprot:CAMPEP_0182496880 /NCGR_PEP_ID=MMETSP1321-20130603/5463_1 /TAXON_ID=91990 /ORGANISM="Bolidomonas sp., Strain RCC1657" /LENGTH=184 /DNA_ID=CAMNT_0024700611 /DNA_START=86 /DNA_END=640 /DNA_ORIENTATION=-